MSEMSDLHPAVTEDERKRQRETLITLVPKPTLWPALAVYVYAKLAANLIFAWKKQRGRHKEWNRDDTSR